MERETARGWHLETAILDIPFLVQFLRARFEPAFRIRKNLEAAGARQLELPG